jgi:ribosomal-protein-alanine N-acetyltransferase
MRSTLYLRPAEEEDRSFIKDLSAEAFAAFGPYRRIVSHWLRDRFVHTYVLEEEGQTTPLGYFMLGLMLPRFLCFTVEVMAIAVIPTHRGKGLGSYMLREAERLVRAEGYRRLRAHVGCENEVALRMFTKAGFRLKKRLKNYYPSGLDAYELVKKLSS